MQTVVNGTTAPWLLAGNGILVLFFFIKTIAAWRATKRSPYFFMRQQAERNLQACLWVMFGLIVLGGGTAAFAWRTPQDDVVRMALLAPAKPVAAAETAESDALPILDFADSPQSVEFSVLSPMEDGTVPVAAVEGDAEGLPSPETLSLIPTLPEEFDQYEPAEELRPETDITPLVFSSEISDDYEPVSPKRVFGEGFFTVYATFDYDGMADGMEWAWVWRRNGDVVNGGNELWNYGVDGPGWIYYEPPEGYEPGEYTLEVWINRELFQRAGFTVESEVANQ